MRDIVSLRIGLSLQTVGLEMWPKEAWTAVESEGQKDGSILPYLADLRGVLQTTDGQMFEGPDIKPVTEVQYYRRLQAREAAAKAIFETIRAFREANAS
jgi:hypothetical protein